MEKKLYSVNPEWISKLSGKRWKEFYQVSDDRAEYDGGYTTLALNAETGKWLYESYAVDEEKSAEFSTFDESKCAAMIDGWEIEKRTEDIYGVYARNRGMWGGMTIPCVDSDGNAIGFETEEMAQKYAEHLRRAAGRINNFTTYFVKKTEIEHK